MSTRNALQTLITFAALQLGALCTVSSVSAHGGELPQAFSIVAIDAQGPVVVRLNEGLAMRRPEGFRYLCPALWGEDTVAPAQSEPGGAVMIGASTGLFVLADDGSVARHVDPAAAGRVVALAASAHGLYALRERETYELIEVRKDAVRVLWRDTERWEDLGASESILSLMRVESGRLIELRLSPDGTLITEGNVEIAGSATNVRVRVAGATSYALLLSSSLQAELGRVDQNRWLSLAKAGAIAGPVETRDGLHFAAIDGALARFEGEQATLLSEPAPVSCLGQQRDLRYACSAGDLRRLEANGLGTTLFALGELLEPELERVPDALRGTCMLQWQRFTIDLLRVGIKPHAVAAAADAGPIDLPDAGAAHESADAEADATPVGADVEDEEHNGQADAETSDEPPARNAPASELDEPEEEALGGEASAPARGIRDAGCGCALGRHGSEHVSEAGLTLFAWLWLRRRSVLSRRGSRAG